MNSPYVYEKPVKALSPWIKPLVFTSIGILSAFGSISYASVDIPKASVSSPKFTSTPVLEEKVVPVPVVAITPPGVSVAVVAAIPTLVVKEAIVLPTLPTLSTYSNLSSATPSGSSTSTSEDDEEDRDEDADEDEDGEDN